MKWAKWLIILVAVLLGLFLVITFFLPKEYEVRRSIDIAAPAPVIYSQVVDLEAWQTWNPWKEMDPDMALRYSEARSGVGASYEWNSEVAGNGRMAIVEATPNAHVRYELVFEGYEDLPSFSSLYLEPTEDLSQTRVIWTFEGTVGDRFFARWMSVLVDKFVGGSYEKGLDALKANCEQLALGLVDPVSTTVPAP